MTAKLHSFQNLHTTKAAIGRPMKVTKENIVGFVTALKLFIEDDEVAEKKHFWYKKAELLMSKPKTKRRTKSLY